MSDRKYYECHIERRKKGTSLFEPVKFSYIEKGVIFSTKKEVYYLYVYEEDGNYYEFYSGMFLANEVDGDGYLVIPESFIRIRTRVIDYSRNYSLEISAVQFAESVKEHMPGKNSIVIQFNRILQDAHKEWLLENQRLQKEVMQREKAQKDATSWLDNLLNSRHN